MQLLKNNKVALVECSALSIKGGLPSVKKFVKGYGNSSLLLHPLGVLRVLVTHPYTMSHAALSPEAKKRNWYIRGINVRISAGLENTDDLTAALNTVG